jgi:hypothetical protein
MTVKKQIKNIFKYLFKALEIFRTATKPFDLRDRLKNLKGN